MTWKPQIGAGYVVVRDCHMEKLWDSRASEWRTQLDGRATVYRTKERARKTAGRLAIYWPEAGVAIYDQGCVTAAE